MSEAAQGDVLTLTVPASTTYVGLLRTMSTAVATRVDLSMDQIEDLRLAVTEASALILDQASPGATITGTYSITAGEMVVDLTGASADPRPPSPDSFAWMVLSALMPRVAATVDDGQLRITLAVDKPVHA